MSFKTASLNYLRFSDILASKSIWHTIKGKPSISTVWFPSVLQSNVWASRVSKKNQTAFCASYCTSLENNLEILNAQNTNDDVRAGLTFLSSSTYVGGDSYMRQNMNNIIAISNKVGYPEIFLTTTCIPQWPDIKNALPSGQSVVNRPDICAPAFLIKLRTLIPYSSEEKVFGNVKAPEKVVEFQKRGLPHRQYFFHLMHESNLMNYDPLVWTQPSPQKFLALPIHYFVK